MNPATEPFFAIRGRKYLLNAFKVPYIGSLWSWIESAVRKLSKKGLCSGILPSFISRVRKVPYQYRANPSVKTDYANTISSKLVPAKSAIWVASRDCTGLRQTLRIPPGRVYCPIEAAEICARNWQGSLRDLWLYLRRHKIVKSRFETNWILSAKKIKDHPCKNYLSTIPKRRATGLQRNLPFYWVMARAHQGRKRFLFQHIWTTYCNNCFDKSSSDLQLPPGRGLYLGD